MFNKTRLILSKFLVGGSTGNVSYDYSLPGMVSRTGLLNEYQGYVYTCINAIATDVAKAEFYMYKVDASGEKIRLANHEFLALLNNPNPSLTKFKLMELSQTYMELTGESWWYMSVRENSRKPVAIYPLRPDLLEVAVDRNTGQTIGYTYYNGAGQRVPLDLDEVLPNIMPNPRDMNRGMGTVEAGLLYVQSEKFASKFTRNFVYNNARPSGVLNLKGTISDDVFARIKKQWTSEYGTVDNAGKTAILRNIDAEFTQLGTGLEGSALRDVKNINRDDILAMFRVPKTVLGISDDVNRASAETTEYVFAKRVVEPKVQRWVDAMQQVVSKYWVGTYIGVENIVPSDENAELQERIAGIDKWLTANEIRAEEGLLPIDGGDVLFRALNDMPIGVGRQQSQANVGKSNYTMTVKKTIKNNIKANVEPMIAVVDDETQKQLDYEQKEIYRQSIMKINSKYTKKINKIIDEQMDKQNKKIKSKLTPAKRLKGIYDDILFDVNSEADDLIKQATPILLDMAKEGGQEAMRITMGNNEAKFRITKQIRDTINKRLALAFPAYETETRTALANILGDAIQEGDSIAKISGKIDEYYKQSKSYRSIRLARTETMKAMSASTREAFEQTGIVTAQKWFANPDACEFCQELNGETVSLTTNFRNIGDTVSATDASGAETTYSVDYDNIDGPPLHPNCTCTTLAVIGD